MIRKYEGAGILLFRKNENNVEVFLGKRRHRPDRGKWSIPGGGKEPYDKDFRVSAERELWEETGFRLDEIDHEDCCELSFDIPFYHWRTFIVMAKGPTPEPRPREFSELRWIPLEDLEDYECVKLLDLEVRKLEEYLKKHPV